MIWLLLLLIGFIAGMLSGMFGIGGGVVIVPLLVFLLGFSQYTATGTSLLVFLLPVGILGALEYYKAGKISVEHLRYAAVIALSLFFGSLFGSRLALSLSEEWVRKGFALLLVIVAARLWFKAS
ncbi:MAG: sulfite exporter TauE/SafE family protein [Chloroherpetonaceae bacterium]|nr:sulfite exporter TauE/SafE family protein [Chloroherpetonaceae bacterium]MCS7210718.1 sulfite exporter TauE/SafE family protein [Chloroherpetonaceae bacterium]MDW8020112.1 sulfite exporter TauE/SafE family protein [Chloroherpetonaceae bacterium]MDW8466453.1 sulfite exporter TauE/SafE family protein [Chloroherpetonaceae bacterium]